MTAADTCEVFCTNTAAVARLRQFAPHTDGLGNLFKALGDETRARILYCLLQHELCVCDLSLILEMSPQAISHHLRLLKAMKLVRSRRQGKLVYYTLDDHHVATLIVEGMAHVLEGR